MGRRVAIQELSLTHMTTHPPAGGALNWELPASQGPLDVHYAKPPKHSFVFLYYTLH